MGRDLVLRRRQAFANVRRVHPLLALALVAVAGLGATRLPWVSWRRWSHSDLLLATGLPLLLAGVLLGPGIGVLDRAVLRALAPVTALAIGWLAAGFGARLEWRVVRRVPPALWGLGTAVAIATFALAALAAWSLLRLRPALGAAWAPALPGVLTLAAVAVVSEPGAVARTALGVGVRRRLVHACALAAGVIVNLSPHRRRVQQLLHDWERPIYAVFLIILGALLAPPTAWILLAVVALTAVRIAAKWGGVRATLLWLRATRWRPGLGFATVAQGGVALALALNFQLTYQGPGSGGLLTTITLGVLLAQLAAPRLMARATAPAPLTPPPRSPEVTG